jgi:hypothetical protein
MPVTPVTTARGRLTERIVNFILQLQVASLHALGQVRYGPQTTDIYETRQHTSLFVMLICRLQLDYQALIANALYFYYLHGI